ncbi:MATE family efflux transporter [Vibrio sp. SCSIO 43137]|uniref:MATE family efflux transporter n=1 Tax=Vibrio sp. SCSIO 43137 TaxID=3021011 RepID=UPI002306E84C|nr:MATE family efflux transporter [Vibrio sp. SCSIO 43137]WCE31051.1 MATE family efflux transporter [Vibrio sp. SCSIO 43137]
MHLYQEEAIKLIRLASPVLLASVAQMGMGFVDTIMAGGVSATDMAAVAVAASIWNPSILFGAGLLMALVPVVAQLNGADKTHKVPFEIFQGFWLSLFLTLPTIAVLFQTQVILGWMDIEPLLAEKTIGYMNAIMWSVPAFLLYQTLRSFTDGMAVTKPAMIIGFIGLAANIPLNWMFVYGKLGAPALGGVGCGVATAIVYWLMFIAMLVYILVSSRLKHVKLLEKNHWPVSRSQIRLIKLGLPVALALFFEITLFAVVALLIAPLGSTIVAAHQVAINFSSMVFMLPMSIGVAVSIRVGQKLGEENTQAAKIASHVALMVGVLCAMATGLLTILFKEPITQLYTSDIDVLNIAVQLLFIAAIYQVTDAIQVVAAGALRGYKDMKAIFICTFIAYWMLGLPAGYLLGLTDVIIERIGVYGFWIGFIIGLSSAAVMLGARLKWMHGQDHETQLRFSLR